MAEEIRLFPVRAEVCELCLKGEGEECHVPGCLFWMQKPPEDRFLDVLRVLAYHPFVI